MLRLSRQQTAAMRTQDYLAIVALFGLLYIFAMGLSSTTGPQSQTTEVALLLSQPEPQSEASSDADIDAWKPRPAFVRFDTQTSTDPDGKLVKKYMPWPGSAGQVRAETGFGKALTRLASRPDVRRAIEIGTWYGQGSTAVIGRAFKSTSDTLEPFNAQSPRTSARRTGAKFLWTLEVFEPAWQFARQYVAQEQLPVRCVLGGTVSSSGVLPPSAIEEREKNDPNSHYSLYYARDIELMKDAEPWLAPLCRAHSPVDFVLIDGNEYTGWAEFEVIDSVCKPRFLAIHDANTLKTQRIEAVIASGRTDWIAWESGVDAVKWVIYVHKEYAKSLQ